MIYSKIHHRVNPRENLPEVTIIAACDADLLGKVHEGKNGTVLDLAKHMSFYKGEKVTPAELSAILEGAQNVNLVGEEAIAAASKVLPLSLKDAKRIGGVPHLQFYRI